MHSRRQSSMVRGRNADTPYERVDDNDSGQDEVELSLLGDGDKGDRHGDEESLLDDEDSTVKMVRQIVPETDIPTLPSLTFRSLLLGCAFLSLIHI